MLNLTTKLCLVLVAFFTPHVCSVSLSFGAQVLIGSDDFDGGGQFLSRTFTPDNSSTGGTFPSSIFDVFGIATRDVNPIFADDTAGFFPEDDFGIIPTGRTDSFLGFADVENPDNNNIEGSATVLWTFDVSNTNELEIAFEIAAMGDFEAATTTFTGDSLSISAFLDNGAGTQIAFGTADNDIDNFQYILESGTEVFLDDPFVIEGNVIGNIFQTLRFPISGEGSILTIELTVQQNSSFEAIAIDNLQLFGTSTATIPEPSSLTLLVLGSIGTLSFGRRRSR